MTSEPAAVPIPPEVIAFDLLGTLFSLASLEPLLAAAGGDASSLDVWWSQLLADGFALTAAREYQPFRDVAKASLRTVLPKGKAAARDRVVTGLNRLEVHPDSGPAMGRTVMNARVAVVSNTSSDHTRKLVARGGLDAFVETITTAEDVKRWKPASDPYALAAAEQEVPLQRMAMVSAHPWDIMGARRAGLVTGWCNRTGATFPTTFGKPDVTGVNLLDVVEKLFVLTGAAPQATPAKRRKSTMVKSPARSDGSSGRQEGAARR
ncbi:MAG TPA: HAD-IA family hydrolase [Acidimicrobiales bacterium]|nr:HAD-IA family hydrolase [Acidimicrobiales bacterium]